MNIPNLQEKQKQVNERVEKDFEQWLQTTDTKLILTALQIAFSLKDTRAIKSCLAVIYADGALKGMEYNQEMVKLIEELKGEKSLSA